MPEKKQTYTYRGGEKITLRKQANRFVVLRGDRYGWCPPPPQIPAEEFNRILAVVEPEERRLLLWEEDGRELGDGVEMVLRDADAKSFVGDKGWYRRDDNAVPAEYVLQPWDGYS